MPWALPRKRLNGALQTDVVDGHDGGSSWAFSQKLHEVQKNISITGHQMVVTAIIINNNAYKKMPKKIQKGITRAAREVAVVNMKWMANNEQTIMGHFKKAGLKFSRPDLKPFQKAVKPVWGQYSKHVGGWGRIKKIQKLQKLTEAM